MGCLVEFFCEFVFELFGEAYFWLMRQAVPKRTFSQKTEKALKIAAGIFSAVLLLAVLAGLIMLTDGDAVISNVGQYMIFISLGLIAIQIILGIVVRIKTNKNK